MYLYVQIKHFKSNINIIFLLYKRKNACYKTSSKGFNFGRNGKNLTRFFCCCEVWSNKRVSLIKYIIIYFSVKLCVINILTRYFIAKVMISMLTKMVGEIYTLIHFTTHTFALFIHSKYKYGKSHLFFISALFHQKFYPKNEMTFLFTYTSQSNM